MLFTETRIPGVLVIDCDVFADDRGAFVRAWVASDRSVPVLRLPHAILRPGSQDEVFAVNPTSQRLESRRISFSTA